MRTSFIRATILLTGWGTAALAADSPCQQCRKDAGQQLQTCLDKAPGETAKQVCRNRAKQAEQSCADGVCKGQGRT